MAARIPHTFRRKNGIYYLRLKWPARIRKQLPELVSDFVCSLMTVCQEEARLRVYTCAGEFARVITSIDMMNPTDRNDVLCAVNRLKQTLISLAQNQAEGAARMVGTPEFEPALELDVEDKILVEVDPATGKQTYKSDLTGEDENQQELLNFLGRAGLLPGGGGGGGGLGPGDNEPLVQAVAEQFVHEKKATGAWRTAKTLSQSRSRLGEIVTMLGPSKPFSSLTRKDIIAVKDLLIARIDTNRTRRSSRDGTLSPDTARSYFQLCTGLVAFAFEQDIIPSNIAAGLTIKISKNAGNSYRPFSDSDLKKIVNGPVYRSTELKSSRKLSDSYFWAPLLAMYSGGRISEISQLCLKDVQCHRSESEQAEIWYINITDDELTQSTKTESSRRRVPLHDQLIDVGFVEFYQQRCAVAGSMSDMLFEDLKFCKSNGWGRDVGRWFNGESASPGYLDLVGLESRENKTFHSFRHTAARRLRNTGVDEADIAATVGHEHKTTTRRYGDGYTLQRLKAIIDQLDYGLDLSHISFADFQDYKICKGRPTKNRHLLSAYRRRVARQNS